MQLANKEFTERELLRRFMENIRRPPKGKSAITRWAMVSHLTGLGSTAAADLCIQFGKNPDDILR